MGSYHRGGQNHAEGATPLSYSTWRSLDFCSAWRQSCFMIFHGFHGKNRRHFSFPAAVSVCVRLPCFGAHWPRFWPPGQQPVAGCTRNAKSPGH